MIVKIEVWADVGTSEQAEVLRKDLNQAILDRNVAIGTLIKRAKVMQGKNVLTASVLDKPVEGC
jgi:hypothetical protein